jgi:hypothetical protein
LEFNQDITVDEIFNPNASSDEEEDNIDLSKGFAKSLIASDWTSFTRLKYFELYTSSDTGQSPFISTKSAKRIALVLPPSVLEACIFAQDSCKDIASFVTPALSTKFHYLGLFFEAVFLPPEVLTNPHLSKQKGVNSQLACLLDSYVKDYHSDRYNI